VTEPERDKGGPLAVDEVLPARVPSVPAKVTKLPSANIALRTKRTVETPVPTKKTFALCKVRSENVGTGLPDGPKNKNEISFGKAVICLLSQT